MAAPDKIYVREYPDGINQFWDKKKRDDVVATIYHEYIRKDALLEWAKKKVNEIEIAMETGADDPVLWGQRNAFKQVIDKINSM